MSCKHPLIGLPTGFNEETGKKSLRIMSIEKLSTDFSRNPKVEFDRLIREYPDSVIIPCGHCLECRLDYSREWANRMMLELECNDRKAVFLTLTYNNSCCPICEYKENGEPIYSLYKRDVQLFLKKLRRYFSEKRIRYYFAGEYGPKTNRPHYHAIIFGLTLLDFPNIALKGKNELGQDFFISPLLDKLWFDESKKQTRGFSLISEVSWKTCAYVARYVQKKMYGDLRPLYGNQVPEFSMMSLKPGIGADYLKLKPDMLNYANINLSTSTGGLQIPIPKYFLRKKELFNSEEYDKMKEDRKMIAENNMILKLQKTGLGYVDYLEVEEQKKIDSVKVLKRDRCE